MTKKKITAKPQVIIRPDKITIAHITLIRGNLDATDAYIANPQEPGGVEVNLNHTFSFGLAEKLCFLQLNIRLEGYNEAKELLGLTAMYTINFVFHIANFEEYFHIEEDTCRVEALLGATLLGIAFSTARGMLLERLKNTYFGNFHLPIADPMVMLNKSEITVKVLPEQQA